MSWVLAHQTGGLKRTQVRVPGKINFHSQGHNHTQLNPEAFGATPQSSPYSHQGQTLQPCDHPLMHQVLFGPTRIQTLQTDSICMESPTRQQHLHTVTASKYYPKSNSPDHKNQGRNSGPSSQKHTGPPKRPTSWIPWHHCFFWKLTHGVCVPWAFS